jgi:hypothetical protein
MGYGYLLCLYVMDIDFIPTVEQITHVITILNKYNVTSKNSDHQSIQEQCQNYNIQKKERANEEAEQSEEFEDYEEFSIKIPVNRGFFVDFLNDDYKNLVRDIGQDLTEIPCRMTVYSVPMHSPMDDPGDPDLGSRYAILERYMGPEAFWENAPECFMDFFPKRFKKVYANLIQELETYLGREINLYFL